MSSEEILSRPPPRAHARIAYGEAPSQFGDLFRPDGEGPFPLVIAIHGGFWRARYDLSHLGHLCAALAAQGLAVWSLEYRRVGEEGGTWPGPARDVHLALSRASTLLAPFGIDTRHTALLGHSAGGHLALHAGSASPLPLRGIVSLASMGDLRAAYEHHLSDDAVVGLLGGTPEEVPARYEEASPLRRLPLGIPQLVVHGRADDCVPFSFSEAWESAARAAGVEVEAFFHPGGHYEPIDPSWSGLERIAGWLGERLY